MYVLTTLYIVICWML